MPKAWWYRIDYWSHKLPIPRWLQRRICDDMDWRLGGDEVGKRFFPFGKTTEWVEVPVEVPKPR